MQEIPAIIVSHRRFEDDFQHLYHRPMYTYFLRSISAGCLCSGNNIIKIVFITGSNTSTITV